MITERWTETKCGKDTTCNTSDPSSTRMDEDIAQRTDQLTLTTTSKFDHDARVTAAWSKERKLIGIICDPKGQVYKIIARPVLLYSSETWSVLVPLTV